MITFVCLTIPSSYFYENNLILQAHNQLVAMLEKYNFTVDDTQNIAGDVSLPIKKLREKDIRIILGNFNETWARKVFCEAYRFVDTIFYSKITIFFFNLYNDL